MFLLRFMKKPSGGESNPLLPAPRNSVEKAASDDVATVLETRKKTKSGTHRVSESTVVLSM